VIPSEKERYIPYYGHLSNEQLYEMANEHLPLLDPEAIQSYYSITTERGLTLTCQLRKMDSRTEILSPDHVSKHNMQFIMQSLEKRLPIHELVSELRSRGIDPWNGYKMITQLPDYLEEKKAAEKEKALNGSMLLFAGLAVRLLPLSSSKHLALIILVYSVCIFGGIKWLDALFRMKRYSKMIEFLSSALKQFDPLPFPVGENDSTIRN
jgi:hypothetical protein